MSEKKSYELSEALQSRLQQAVQQRDAAEKFIIQILQGFLYAKGEDVDMDWELDPMCRYLYLNEPKLPVQNPIPPVDEGANLTEAEQPSLP